MPRYKAPEALWNEAYIQYAAVMKGKGNPPKADKLCRFAMRTTNSAAMQGRYQFFI